MLHATGERVIVLDRLKATSIPHVIGDIADRALVARTIIEHSVDAIIHLAASTSVPESLSDPLGYYRNNTIASHALIETVIEHRIKHFVFTSTAAVYGNPIASPTDEDDPKEPISPYGASKLMTETMLHGISTTNKLNSVILRCFNVAGAGHPASATHLIKTAIDAVRGKTSSLKIYGDGTCIRDYVHVRDVAQAHINALGYLRRNQPSTVVNCGRGHGYSVLQAVNVIKRISGVNFPIEYTQARPGDPAQIVANTSRIRKLLGWQPQFDSLAAIIASALSPADKL